LGDEGFCDNRVKRLATINFDDERGLLCPIDFTDHGFSVVRAFTISGTLGAVRGGHAHRLGRQILMLVSGLIEIEIRWKERLERLQLDPLNRVLLIEPLVWSRQIYRGDHSSMVVFCDTAYDPSDYILEVEA
jgi:dTDP-4-dehydrorhamnose 3,5-epimerase-like enzyme